MQVVATAVIAVIATLPLWAIAAYQWPLAQGDTWIFIQHYLNYSEGRAGWSSLLSAHGPHPGMVLRPVLLLPVTVGNGDFSWLTWLSWLAAAASFVFIALLLGRQWRRFGTASGADDQNGPLLLLVVAAALVFSMGQGLAWTWEFVWINWLPGACLAALLWFDQVTSDRDPTGMRRARPLRDWLVRGALALVALTAFGTGMFVWLVLALGWLARRACGDRSAPGWRAQLLWCPLFALLTWLLVLMPARGGDGGLGHLLERPLMTLHYLLCLVGGSLANGTDIDPAWQGAAVGAAVLAILAAGLVYGWMHRRERALMLALLPWFQAAAFAGLASALITMGRMHLTVYTAFASRYLTLTFWLPLAAAVVLVFCVRHWLARRERAATAAGAGADTDNWAPNKGALAVARWRARLTLGGGWLAGIAAALWACQGWWGLHDMRWYHREKLTVAAAYQFIDVLPGEIDRALAGVSVGRQHQVRFLRERDQLPGIDPLPSPDPAHLRLRAGLNDTEWSARLTGDLDAEGGQRLELRGFARMNSRREPPDLLVVTVAPAAAGQQPAEPPADDEPWPGERIAALVAVQRPIDFDRRQYHPNLYRQHYLGFADEVPIGLLQRALETPPTDDGAIPGEVTVRLYGIDFRRRVGRRLAGIEVIELGTGSAGGGPGAAE